MGLEKRNAGNGEKMMEEEKRGRKGEWREGRKVSNEGEERREEKKKRKEKKRGRRKEEWK